MGYGVYASQRSPAESAALKNPFAITHSSTADAASRPPLAAISVLLPDGGSGVSGTVRFTQDAPGAPTRITATLTGLKDGLHGFHVHEVVSGARSAVMPLIIARLHVSTASVPL